MWTDDDVLITRWQRWHRRVMAINLDALLRWALVVMSITMAVSLLVGLVSLVWGVMVSAVTFIAGWF